MGRCQCIEWGALPSTEIQPEDGDARAVAPVHERLAHLMDKNTRLACLGEEASVEVVTRDNVSAPRLLKNASVEGSTLHLLLQFGLRPNAWPTS